MRLIAALTAVGLILGLQAASIAQGPARQLTRQAQWVTARVTAPGVEQRVFHSEAAGSPVSYHVLIPPQYDEQTQRRFPVLYWLHGSGGSVGGVRTVSAHFAAAMRQGKMPPMIVVMPNGLPLSLWVDSKDGAVPVESMVVRELVPHIDATFRTIPSREGRIVEGFSMGGYGAARFGLKYPELFAAASALGAGPMQQVFDHGPRVTERQREWVLQSVFGGDHGQFAEVSPWVLAERNAEAVRGKVLLRIAAGELDETLPANVEFHRHLERLEIPHTFTVAPGVGHDALRLLSTLGEANWEFYSEALKPTDRP